MWIRKVRVGMSQRTMSMGMEMRLARRIALAMLMLMMRIMNMGMRVFKQGVIMVMFVVFGEMKPDAKAHEQGGNCELQGERFTQVQNCN